MVFIITALYLSHCEIENNNVISSLSVTGPCSGISLSTSAKIEINYSTISCHTVIQQQAHNYLCRNKECVDKLHVLLSSSVKIEYLQAVQFKNDM